MQTTQIQPRARRPRPQVVSLTESAAERVREILGKAERPFAGLRVGVKNGGCAGMEYTLEYASAADPLDEVVEDKGVRILVEPKAVLFLLGSQIDYETSKLSAKFVFSNPNQTDACGCGESVTIVPAARPLRDIRHTDKIVTSDEKAAHAVRRGKGSSLWNCVESFRDGRPMVPAHGVDRYHNRIRHASLRPPN